MSLPSRFQRYDSLIDLLVEQAVCDALEEQEGQFAAENSGIRRKAAANQPSLETVEQGRNCS